MKKNLIALVASAAMIVPAAAMAGDVKVYGQAQAELSSFDDGGTAGAVLDMIDNGRGRVGVKASEDLGNGWKALAQFEFKADTITNNTDSTSCSASSTSTTTPSAGTATTVTTTTCSTKAKASLTGRNSMVGLKGKSGQFELGRLKQAYKYTGGVKYDPFVTTLLEARGNGGMSGKTGKGSDMGHSSFHSAALGYRGKFGPVKVQVTYGPEEDDGSMTASAMIKQKNFEAFIAIADDGDRTSTTVDGYSATKIGGAWMSGMHKVTGQYEMADLGGAGTAVEPTILFVGYQGKMGKNTFVAQIGQLDADGTTSAGDVAYMALGVVHKMSKMTRLMAGYRSSTVDGGTASDTDITAISVAMRKDFK